MFEQQMFENYAGKPYGYVMAKFPAIVRTLMTDFKYHRIAIPPHVFIANFFDYREYDPKYNWYFKLYLHFEDEGEWCLPYLPNTNAESPSGCQICIGRESGIEYIKDELITHHTLEKLITKFWSGIFNEDWHYCVRYYAEKWEGKNRYACYPPISAMYWLDMLAAKTKENPEFWKGQLVNPKLFSFEKHLENFRAFSS